MAGHDQNLRLTQRIVTTTNSTVVTPTSVLYHWDQDPGPVQGMRQATGNPEIILPNSNYAAGRGMLMATGHSMLVGEYGLPYLHGALYKMSMVIRCGISGNTSTLYAGVAGLRTQFSDGTWQYVNINGENALSNQHYFVSAGSAITSNYTLLEGFFRGFGSTGNGGRHGDRNDPGTLHQSADYVVPILYLNYQNSADTYCYVPYVMLQVVP